MLRTRRYEGSRACADLRGGAGKRGEERFTKEVRAQESDRGLDVIAGAQEREMGVVTVTIIVLGIIDTVVRR